MNYQPNQQGGYPPQQPYQGQPNQAPYPQQQMPYPPMQQQMSQPMQPMMQQPLQMSQPMQPMMQQPLQMSQPMQPIMQQPMQGMPPMQQTGSVPYPPQDQFAASQSFAPVQPMGQPMQPAPVQPMQEKSDFFHTALDYVREHQLFALIGAAVVALLYLLFILLLSGWNLGKLIPFIIVLVASLGATGAAIILRKKFISLSACAGYVLAMLLFLNYFFILLPSAALCALDFFNREE